MRHAYRNICLVSMLVTVLTAQAVQLGSSKGLVVFGRPLDLTVQVRLDAPYDESTNCFSADAFQADNKLDAGRIRLDVTPTANSLDVSIRVRSISPVNEPWAKIVLRSNCGSKISRQYDFLTDFAADTPTSSTLAEIALPQLTTATIASTSPSKLVAKQQISSATLGTSSANAATATAPVSNWNVKRSQANVKVKTQPQKPNSDTSLALKKVSPATQTVVAPKKTTELVADAVGQSRLKMETFELTDEHQVLLKLSSALTAPTGMRTPEEIQALAQATAVWRAINGMPAEVKAATAAVAVAASPAISPATPTPTAVNQKLADKSAFSNLVVYGLIGLLALTMGCIAWLWLRVNKASRAGYGWLNDSVNEEPIVSSEPFHSQFLPAKERVGASDAHDSYEPMFDEEVEKAEPTRQVVEKSSEIAVGKEKIFAISSNDNQIVSALPLHFDEPRLNERVLRAHKKPRDSSHEKPITTPAELIDFELLDGPPKLHAVTAPAAETAASETISKSDYKTLTAKPSLVKDNAKGNLIDFDVFAEPTASAPDKSSDIGVLKFKF